MDMLLLSVRHGRSAGSWELESSSLNNHCWLRMWQKPCSCVDLSPKRYQHQTNKTHKDIIVIFELALTKHFRVGELLYFATDSCVNHGDAIKGRAPPPPLLPSLGCHTQCVKVWSHLKLAEIPSLCCAHWPMSSTSAPAGKTTNLSTKLEHRLSLDLNNNQIICTQTVTVCIVCFNLSPIGMKWKWPVRL